MNYSHRHRPPYPTRVGAGRRSKTLPRVLSATVARQEQKVPDDQPAQINNELPGTNGRRATPTCPYFHSCRHPLGKRQLTGRVDRDFRFAEHWRRSAGRGRGRQGDGRARQGVRLGSKSGPAAPTISDSEPKTRRPLLLLIAGAGLCRTALDAYVVVTLLPVMIADVGLTIDRFEQATPIVTGFLGGYVVAMPLLGAYSDVRGRAPVYAFCMLVFAIGSAVTATAGMWSFAGLPWLVAGRFLQGLGGGGLVPLSLALSPDLYPDARPTAALGSGAAMPEAGSGVGPLYRATLAAAAASIGGWRFVFWLNLPLAGVCAAGLLLGSRKQSRIDVAAASSLDWVGAGLLGLGLGLLGRALYPDDPGTRAPRALPRPVGALSLIVLGLYARRQATRLEPLIPQ